MSNSNNDGGILVIGGGIIIVVMVMALSKALKKMFMYLEQSLNALGSMIGTFFEVSFVFLVTAAWVALIIAIIVCALWFARSFVDLVKNAKKVMKYSKRVTDNCMDDTDTKLNNFDSEFKDSLSHYESRLNWLESKLEEALKPPEVQAAQINDEEKEVAGESIEEESTDETNDAMNPY